MQKYIEATANTVITDLEGLESDTIKDLQNGNKNFKAFN